MASNYGSQPLEGLLRSQSCLAVVDSVETLTTADRDSTAATAVWADLFHSCVRRAWSLNGCSVSQIRWAKAKSRLAWVRRKHKQLLAVLHSIVALSLVWSSSNEKCFWAECKLWKCQLWLWLSHHVIFLQRLWNHYLRSSTLWFLQPVVVGVRPRSSLLSLSLRAGWEEERGGVTWPRCSAALTRGLLKSLSRLAAINTAVHPLRRRSV